MSEAIKVVMQTVKLGRELLLGALNVTGLVIMKAKRRMWWWLRLREGMVMVAVRTDALQASHSYYGGRKCTIIFSVERVPGVSMPTSTFPNWSPGTRQQVDTMHFVFNLY